MHAKPTKGEKCLNQIRTAIIWIKNELHYIKHSLKEVRSCLCGCVISRIVIKCIEMRRCTGRWSRQHSSEMENCIEIIALYFDGIRLNIGLPELNTTRMLSTLSRASCRCRCHSSINHDSRHKFEEGSSSAAKSGEE